VAEYHALIAEAVGSLDQNTGEARRAVYERARKAQVTQLRAIRPPLSESVIAKERLALESAIREVEADATRKSETKPREPRPEIAPAQPPAVPMHSKRSEQDRLGLVSFLGSETSQPAERLRRLFIGKRTQSFDDVLNEMHRSDTTAKTAQEGRDGSGDPTPSQTCRSAEGETSPSSSDVELGADAEDLSTTLDEARQPRGGTPSDDLNENQESPLPPQDLPEAMEADHLQPLAPRRFHRLVKSVVALLILAGLAATISWQWPQVSELYRDVGQIVAKQQPSQTVPQTASQSSFLDRFPQEQNIAATGTPGSQISSTVAQRVVLYEEDSSDPQGKRYFGLVTWRTETVSPGPSSDVAVRADVRIPERRISMTWLLRRNIDPALAASHIIEMIFNLPADFSGGGVAGVPGVLTKRSEQEPGTPLAKLAARATNGVFIIDLSAAGADKQRNVQLLKESPWFDIPIVYTNGSRAILAIEKGSPGDGAFAEAFTVWEKK
jgi:hypothetical protein